MSGSVSSLPTTVFCTYPTISVPGSISKRWVAVGFGSTGAGGGAGGGGGSTGTCRNRVQPAAPRATAVASNNRGDLIIRPIYSKAGRSGNSLWEAAAAWGPAG